MDVEWFITRVDGVVTEIVKEEPLMCGPATMSVGGVVIGTAANIRVRRSMRIETIGEAFKRLMEEDPWLTGT